MTRRLFWLTLCFERERIWPVGVSAKTLEEHHRHSPCTTNICSGSGLGAVDCGLKAPALLGSRRMA